MSTRAEEFVATLKSDTQLQSQLGAATTDAERKQVVTDAGYGDVSSADAQAVMAGASDSEELSDDQLSAASGAGGIWLGGGGFGGGISW